MSGLPVPESSGSARLSPWAWVAGLVLLTIAVYGQTATFQFVNFDDGAYVFQSPIVRPGLTPQTVVMAFTRFDTANWHPLTWLSLLCDRTVFGLHPTPFHVHNVLLHLASTLVLFQTLREATGENGRSAFVAALFAIHPLHVESVAWISERKDVLSGLFWMLTLWCHGRYARQPSRRWAVAVFVAMLVGLLAKQMLVSLPCVLLLFDVWPLRRWTLGDGWGRLWPLVREKLPLFALSVGFSVVVFLAQRAGKAVQSLDALPVEQRVANAVVAYVMYLVKTVWPFQLAVFYPYGTNAWPAAAVVAAALALLAVTVLCVRHGRRNPVLPVGWLWYLGTLVPVIGLVQVGGQAMADRYTYLPLIGIFLIVAWGVPWERLLTTRARAAAGLLVVALLSVRAYGQVATWYDSGTLFEHALRVAPSTVAYNNLGLAYRDREEFERAEELFREAVAADPSNVSAWSNLGTILQRRADYAGAQEMYLRALEVNPEHAEALISYGDLLNTVGQVFETEGQFENAAQQYLKAESLLRQALAINPDTPTVHVNLGVSLQHQHRWDEAVAEYQQALEIDPKSELALHNLGSLYAQRGRYQEAIPYFERALAVVPDQHLTRVLLATALSEGQQYDRALAELDTVLKADPKFEPALTLRGDIRKRMNGQM